MNKSPNIAAVLLSPKFSQRCYSSAMVLFLLIVVMGSLPGARQDIAQLASGLVLHAGAYASLGALVFFGSRGPAARRAVKTALTIALMGAIDEYVQSFFPYRTAAVSDWLVDVAAGSVVAVVLCTAWPALTRQAVAD
jgi:VanZ family protein